MIETTDDTTDCKYYRSRINGSATGLNALNSFPRGNPRKVKVVDHFYSERSMRLNTLSRKYCGKEYTKRCHKINIETQDLIETYEHRVFTSKLKGDKVYVYALRNGALVELV